MNSRPKKLFYITIAFDSIKYFAVNKQNPEIITRQKTMETLHSVSSVGDIRMTLFLSNNTTLRPKKRTNLHVLEGNSLQLFKDVASQNATSYTLMNKVGLNLKPAPPPS